VAVEYKLTLAAATPVEQIAERAFPDLGERPVGTVPVLTAYLSEQRGFVVSVVAGESRYIDVLSDDGSWEWEPAPYVSVGFRLDNDADRTWAVSNMMTAVRRILGSGREDAVLVLNGDILLLARLDGVLVRHHSADWWAAHPAADGLMVGL
jgi:hypothetical protein